MNIYKQIDVHAKDCIDKKIQLEEYICGVSNLQGVTELTSPDILLLYTFKAYYQEKYPTLDCIWEQLLEDIISIDEYENIERYVRDMVVAANPKNPDFNSYPSNEKIETRLSGIQSDKCSIHMWSIFTVGQDKVSYYVVCKKDGKPNYTSVMGSYNVTKNLFKLLFKEEFNMEWR